jgi:hypothetical protein
MQRGPRSSPGFDDFEAERGKKANNAEMRWRIGSENEIVELRYLDKGLEERSALAETAWLGRSACVAWGAFNIEA